MNGFVKLTPRALALAGLLLSAALAGCAPGVRVTVNNDASQRLTALEVFGEKRLARVKDLSPGESVSVSFAPDGEDAIALRGHLGGRSLVPSMAAYVESGYRVAMRVDSAGYVHVTVGGPGY